MTTYAKLAPEISTIFTQSQTEVFFETIPAPKEPEPEEPATAEQLLPLANAWKIDFATYNGIRDVARSIGLTVEHTKRLIAELDALYSVWTALQEVP